jgi:hypothetical protein
MAVSVEIHHTGSVPEVRAEIAVIIGHAPADRHGALALCSRGVN